MLARFALFIQHSRQHVDQHVGGTANRANMLEVPQTVPTCWRYRKPCQHANGWLDVGPGGVKGGEMSLNCLIGLVSISMQFVLI